MCFCVLFGLYVAFNNLSVISRRCLDVAGSSLLTFRVLPHWNITPQTLDMIFHPVTLYWHWADQFYLFFLNAECQAKEQLVPILKSFVWFGWGSNPKPRSQSGRSTNWATVPVQYTGFKRMTRLSSAQFTNDVLRVAWTSARVMKCNALQKHAYSNI